MFSFEGKFIEESAVATLPPREQEETDKTHPDKVLKPTQMISK